MAATGTPTPNIGLRRPQGTDPASVDDINYNSNLIDTKLGAVGNTSVQEQINSLNSNCVKVLLVQKTVTIASGARINTSVPYTLPTNASFKAVLLLGTPNAAWITGSISSYSATTCDVGLHNNATSEVTGTLSVVVLYA